ncbi:MAG: hypothetical protein IPJ40_07680 [Saprospirales bacterium]|nr:hypothetical protein [Saprospirales bacterium]
MLKTLPCFQQQHYRADIHQGVADHDVGKKAGAKFQAEPYEKSKGKEHSETPKDEIHLEDQGDPDMLERQKKEARAQANQPFWSCFSIRGMA